MKRLSAIVLSVVMMTTVSAASFVKKADAEEKAFVTVKIPFPDNIDRIDSWRTIAVYRDSGEPITLSSVYEDYIWATIPKENKDRAIEGIIPEEKTFVDIDDNDGEYYSLAWLSRTGVIRGNDKGEARPLADVTRAEAVAMIMRFLGLEDLSAYYTDKISAGYEKTKGFDDVHENDWFYYVVSYANKCGIVKGDSDTTFSPNRNVTREEVTVMTARALQYAGLRCLPGEADNIADKDKISDWAKEAYDYLGTSYIWDYDDDEEPSENPKGYLNPQKNASRADVAHILTNVEGICQIYPSDIAVQYGFDKEMPVIDGSTSTYPFTTAVYERLFQNGRTHSQFPSKHSKTHASYERLINGEVDMIFVSHQPSSDIDELARVNGVELELIPIAYDAMVFFTNADNPATGITSEEISNIYLNNAYDNWSEIGGSDALLYPYCRNNDSGSHSQMEKYFLNGGKIHPDVREETTSYTMTNVLTDVIESQTESPVGYGLGYSIYYFFNNMDLFFNTKTELKLLEVDGVAPSDETIADGSYPLSNNAYIVIRKDEPEDSPVRKMAEFMLTEEGQQCVADAGYGRLTEPHEEYSRLSFADKLNTQMPRNENYVFSPLSVKTVLALAANGAEGETREEITETLCISDLELFNDMIKDLIARYSESDILNLKLADSIWINTDKTEQKFSGDFKTVAKKYFAADVKTVKSKNAVEEINTWVNDKTEGKITSVTDNADFWAMLVNAIYFRGGWKDEFSERATKPDIFTNADGTKKQIDFMNQTDWYSYANTGRAEIVELPYQNREDIFDENDEYIDTIVSNCDTSMYLIMTDENINFEEELECAFGNESFESRYVKLALPKFKIDCTINLNDALKELGISKAYSTDAEFENMFDQGSMSITDVLHKTYIGIDEKGTEAAAVTAIGMAGSSLPPEPLELRFDKPFGFIIRDNTSGEVLFMGRFAVAN